MINRGMKYESAIALRYLRSKRKDKFISFTTWISVVGIGIGVMALILVIAVMTGAQDEFRDRILGANPHILISSIEGEIRDPDRLVKKVEGVEGVASAAPFITLQAMAQGRSRISGTVVKGIPPNDTGFVKFIKEGDVNSLRKSGTILVGKELASNLNLLPGLLRGRMAVFA